MPKDQILKVRIDAETKELIAKGAECEVSTMTEFITRAAVSRARKAIKDAERLDSKRGSDLLVVNLKDDDLNRTRFRRICKMAQHGGRYNYRQCGIFLAKWAHHPTTIWRPQVTDDGYTYVPLATQEEIDHAQELEDATVAGDWKTVWRWLRERFPDEMKRIPPRHKKRFFMGVERYFEIERRHRGKESGDKGN